MRIHFITPFVAAVALLAACGDSTARPAGEAATETLPSAATPAEADIERPAGDELIDPLHELILGAPTLDHHRYEVDKLTVECMRASGWDLTYEPPAPTWPVTWGDLRAGKTFGDGVVVSGSALLLQGSGLSFETMTDEQAAKWRADYGAEFVEEGSEGASQTDGCRSAAEASVSARSPLDAETRAELEVRQAQAFHATVPAWQACMAAKGVATDQGRATDASTDRNAHAADTDCRERTQYAEIRANAELVLEELVGDGSLDAGLASTLLSDD